MYRTKKVFPYSSGLSCAFRQWRADSHCSKVHGYALQVELGLVSETLDKNHWCFDFGGFREVKEWLAGWFDHTLLVADDDPLKDLFVQLAAKGGANVRLLPNVGCEAFAQFIHGMLALEIYTQSQHRVKLSYVTVSEHESNSATYVPDVE